MMGFKKWVYGRMKLEQVFNGSGRKDSEETIILVVVVVVVVLIRSWLERGRGRRVCVCSFWNWNVMKVCLNS
jgi:hypothetical protein